MTVLRISVEERGSTVAIAIEDNGPGFQPEVIRTGHALFASTKRQGSGFGLPIVTAILTAHGGSLEIANGEGGGGRVTCMLPRR